MYILILITILIVITIWLVKGYYKFTHYPECKQRLGKIKQNKNGWAYKECLNPKCDVIAIGLENVLI